MSKWDKFLLHLWSAWFRLNFEECKPHPRLYDSLFKLWQVVRCHSCWQLSRVLFFLLFFFLLPFNQSVLNLSMMMTTVIKLAARAPLAETCLSPFVLPPLHHRLPLFIINYLWVSSSFSSHFPSSSIVDCYLFPPHRYIIKIAKRWRGKNCEFQ